MSYPAGKPLRVYASNSYETLCVACFSVGVCGSFFRYPCVSPDLIRSLFIFNKNLILAIGLIANLSNMKLQCSRYLSNKRFKIVNKNVGKSIALAGVGFFGFNKQSTGHDITPEQKDPRLNLKSRGAQALNLCKSNRISKAIQSHTISLKLHKRSPRYNNKTHRIKPQKRLANSL